MLSRDRDSKSDVMRTIRLVLTLISVTGALILSSAPDVGAERQVDPSQGKASFSEAGCGRCHSVETQEIEASIASERMRGPDLSQIGSDHDVDWLMAYVKREETVDGDRHRTPYSGSDDDLQVIAAWLEKLK